VFTFINVYVRGIRSYFERTGMYLYDMYVH